ncbi:MAG: sulfotransferase [Pseudomonadota bacterium]
MSDIKATFAQAMALQKAGRGEAALPLYTGILLQNPNLAEVHFQIGRIHAAGGNMAKARASLRRALELKPAERVVWRGLAATLPAAEIGEVLTEVARGLSPADQAHLGANAWAESGILAGEPVLQMSLRAGAEAARLPLARLLLAACRPEEAETVLSAAKDKTAEIWSLLATIRARLLHPDAAAKAAKGAIDAGANPLRMQVDLASALWQNGELDRAISVIETAIAARPKVGALHAKRGQFAQSQGRMDDASADLLRAIDLDPGGGEAYRAYLGSGKVAADDPILPLIDTALARSDLRPASRWRLHFAKAKALDDLGQTQDVFTHLRKANSQQRAAYPYNIDTAINNARAQLASFRDQLQGRKSEGPRDTVLFVTGLPRSGTTLVETIFAAHNAVTAGGEMPFSGEALAPVTEALNRDLSLTPAALVEPARRYLASARRRLGLAEDDIFTDKAIGTFTRMGPLAMALPGAQFFVLRRDPRDVGLSAYRNMFADGRQRFANDLNDIGRFIRLHDAMVDAWQALLGERICIVDYDELTAQPEPVIRRIIRDAGLQWQDACLAPHKAKRRVETLSFAQVRQPIYRDSIEGWRRFETELSPLFEALEEPIDLM